jgi:uncharacterized protein (TIGR03067 family)
LPYRLDPTQDPKTIDLLGLDRNDPQKSTAGIYKIEQGKLIVCLAAPGSSVRPTDFSPAAPSHRRHTFIRK